MDLIKIGTFTKNCRKDRRKDMDNKEAVVRVFDTNEMVEAFCIKHKQKMKSAIVIHDNGNGDFSVFG